MLLLLTLACAPDDDFGGGGGRPDAPADVAQLGDPPCADGTWGKVLDPEERIHLRVDGNDGGEGTGLDPLQTLTAALQRMEPIAVGPGTFAGGLALPTGANLVGCSATESIVEGGLEISASTGVFLEGLELRGGSPGLAVNAGAGVEAIWLRVVEAEGIGILVDGATTDADLRDVEVHDTLEGELGPGYGVVALQTDIQLTGGGVWEARGSGIVVADGDLETYNVTVSRTRPDGDGTLGRGISVIRSTGRIRNSVVESNHDVGLLLQDTVGFIVRSSEISDTTGDGLVVDGGTSVEVIETTSLGNTRAGMIFDGTTGTLTDTSADTSNSYCVDELSRFSQNESAMSGDETIALNEPLEGSW